MNQRPFDSGRNGSSRLRWLLIGAAAAIGVLGATQFAGANSSSNTIRARKVYRAHREFRDRPGRAAAA